MVPKMQHQKSSNLASWVITLKCGQLIHGHSAILATMENVKSMLGVKLLRNNGFSV